MRDAPRSYMFPRNKAGSVQPSGSGPAAPTARPVGLLNATILRMVFGPLNGVRTALVTLAGVTAVIAAFYGQWMVTLFLGLGVAGHALGWWYLYRTRERADFRQPD